MRFKLLPREEKFYSFFHAQAALIQQASRLLIEEASSHNGIRAQRASEIADLETRGDTVVHEVFKRLNTTFITPHDPEDIHLLASRLDDVLDTIEDVAYRLSCYCPRTRNSEVEEVCRLVSACAEKVLQGVIALEVRHDVSQICKDIGDIESQTDYVIRDAIRELMENEKDAIEVMKVKEIYEFLERTADRCEDVADSLQNVMVNNA